MASTRCEAGEVAEPVAGALLEGEACFGGRRLRLARVVKWGSPNSSPTTRRPVRLEDSVDLAQGGDRLGDLAQDGGQDHGIDRGVLVGEAGRIALGGNYVRQAAFPARCMTWSRNSCWRSKISMLPPPTHFAMSRV